MLTDAKKYIENNISVIGCRNKVATSGSWSQYREKRATNAELDYFFNTRGADQIAIICGPISGNLEVIDIDEPDIWDALYAETLDYFDGNIPLPIVKTPGGYHIYYRCETIEGNQKLARYKDDDGRIQVIAETRGDGGYVIAPPSDGYKILTGDPFNIPTIQDWQRADLLELCRSFNQLYEVEKSKGQAPTTKKHNYKNTPWDAYNEDTSDPWRDVLLDEGWTQTKTDDAREYWRRPGSENVHSANWHTEKRLFYVFTSSTKFESEKAYPPSAIHAIIKHDGDFKEASRALLDAGYGKTYSPWELGLIKKGAKKISEGMTPHQLAEIISDEKKSGKLLDLKAIRNEMGINQKELADFLDINQPQLSKIENKRRQFTYNLLEKLQGHDKYDLSNPAIKKFDTQAEDSLFNTVSTLVDASMNYHDATIGDFWYQHKKVTKTDYLKLSKFFTSQGFRLLKDDKYQTSGMPVHMNEDKKTIVQVNRVYFKKFTQRWAENADLTEYDVDIDTIMRLIISIPNAKWDNVVEFLDHVTYDEINILRDTKTEAFFPFKNGVVKVTRTGPELLRYQDLPSDVYLWEQSIKSRTVDLSYLESESDKNRSNFYKFIKRLAGINPTIEHLEESQLKEKHPKKLNRLQSIITHLGYLLHNFRDPSKPYGVFIGENTIEHGRGGGTGKSLIGKALKEARNIHIEGGKTFKPNDDRRYQAVPLGTDIITIEDVPSWFKVEKMYNDFTELMSIERKFQDPILIPYSRLPKFMFTSNYDLEGNGAEHFNRRIKKILIEKYFNRNLTPEDEFGEQFFGEDWELGSSWSDFYNVLFYFLSSYLDTDLVACEDMDNLKAKSIIAKFKEHGVDAFDFMDEYMREYFIVSERDFPAGKWVGHRDMYEEFLSSSDLESKDFHMNSFKSLILTYCSKFDIDIVKVKDKDGTHGKRNSYIYQYKRIEVPVNVQETTEETPF